MLASIRRRICDAPVLLAMAARRQPCPTIVPHNHRDPRDRTAGGAVHRGATYRPIVGDDTGEGLPIRTGIQISSPGYCTAVHSHPYVETLMLERTGEVWPDVEAEKLAIEPGGQGGVAGQPAACLPGDRRHAIGHLRHPYLRQADRQLPGRAAILTSD